MARILVLYYSSYGHTAQMAEAVAKGVREAGHECDIRHVPETAPQEVVESAGFQKMEGHQCIEGPEHLENYAGIVVGSPTRYGRMSSQMASFWDQTGGLWQKGALVGKVGAAFTSTASQHGGQETTCFSILTNLLHMGCTVVGLDYGFDGQMGVDAVHGGTPYGASTIAAGDGSRQPSEVDLAGATYLGRRVAQAAAKLHG
ncbi:NAD(P)H:quinone oxidoreductase [Aurantiacibacter spongiae]|uniref:NAD(P)H dehydrogenase (quinone) n=1 Tax=Aurantiacibacter spongiae TaxID=2488860 RepID=A0A3N5CPG6_9SPHN|nr:NAD(P)H:quinone oxidoreductase [Aurantiacibacter spongiae]RPF70874.1 NAD(P)H:quinone oxidoreductase [Aurantiacibacter spongiae]